MLFFFQKILLTNVEDNTNVQFVEVNIGFRVEGHQLKVFIDNIIDQIFNFSKINPLMDCYHFV